MAERRILTDRARALRSATKGGAGEMLTGAFGTLTLRCAAAVFAFLSTLLLARHLGVSGYGTYAWAVAWASILQIVTTLGFDILAIREFAAHKVSYAWSTMRGLLRTGSIMVLLGSTIISLLAIAGGLVFIGSTQQLTFVIAVAFAPVLALTMACQGAIQGLGSVVASRLPNDFAGPIVYLGLLLLAWPVLGLRQSAPIAVALQGAAIVVAFLFGLALLRRALPAQVALTKAQPLAYQWLKRAIPLGLLNSLAIALAQIDVVLLGILVNSTQVGLYSTAARVASFVGIAELAVNAAYLPVVARLFATNRIDRLRTGAPMVTLGATLLSIALAAPLIVFAPQVLGLFGSSFSSGAFILRLLCLAFVISAAAGQNGTLLMMTKHVRPMLIGSGVALVANVGLNLIFIPLQAARGAAIAWLLTAIVWNGLLSWQVRRIHGFTATLSGLVLVLRERVHEPRQSDEDV